ncbi:tetratricopeptide repeat protein [Sorangium sp. So ce381]|uniref:tetratricopeptide repeat protein n=1 Tax=Sorangium sp. So ce381 TaxID=3133307 RepID=UPI003F5B1174
MKEKDDVLREAARALRAEADASRGRRDETRARVMRSLKAQRARRLAMVRVVVPLAAVLVGSVAWASAARWFPGGWDDVASRLGLRVSEAPSMPPAPPPQRALSGPRHAAEAPAPPEAEAPAPPEAEAPAPPAAEASAEAVAPEQPPLPAPIAEPPIAPAPPRAPVLAVAPVRSASRPVAAVAPSAARLPAAPRPAAGDPQAIERPPAGPDADALYQAAHRAHFVERSPAAALDAWNAYLAAAPHGRFAVEAQYNRALCLVRLGRADEARRALEPFAQGAFGGYRQTESRSLLEAMRGADE